MSLYDALKEYQGSLNDGSAFLFDSASTHGFSEELNCSTIFTINDVLRNSQCFLLSMQKTFRDLCKRSLRILHYTMTS